MRIALVSPTYLGSHSGVDRHVDRLAYALAARGAEVGILTQGSMRGSRRSLNGPIRGGVTVRRFSSVVDPLRFPLTPAFYEGLRAAARDFDLVDVYTAYPPLALAVARAGFRRRVFTPYGAVHRLIKGPYAYVAGRIIESCARVVCSSANERVQLARRFPWATDRIRAVPPGVDVAALEPASPFAPAGHVVLVAARLERSNRIDRAIAAMAGLEPTWRLVIIGEGPARERLEAYAADLRLSDRVEFIGPVSDRDLYRWLRTARVVVALPDNCASGLEVLEALAVGTPVVASDLAVHREVVAQFASPSVIFVPTAGSPLQVADAIAAVARRRVQAYTDESLIRSWEAVVDDTWELYHELVHGASARCNGCGSRPVPADLTLIPNQVVGG